MKILLTAFTFLCAMPWSFLRAESPQVTFIFNHVDQSQYHIAAMNIKKHILKLNASLSSKQVLYKMDLSNGSDTVNVPMDHYYGCFTFDFSANNALGEWTSFSTLDVPRNQPVFALEGDTLVFDFEFLPSKNPKYPSLKCNISGSSRDEFYKFQLRPEPVTHINDNLLYSARDMKESVNSMRFLALIDSSMREVKALTEDLCKNWDIDPYLSDIIVTNQISTTFSMALSQFETRLQGITDSGEIAKYEKSLEQMIPSKWFEGIDDEAIGESYFVAKPWYNHIELRAALTKFKPGMTFNPYAETNNSARQLYDSLKTIPQDYLRSKLLWMWFILRNTSERVKISDYRPEIDDLLVDVYRDEILTKPAYKDYEFEDLNGKVRTLSEFEGKVVVIDFWFTGCRGCLAMKKELDKAEKLLMNNSEIVFLNINVDLNRKSWLKSIDGGQYATEHSVKLSTMDKGRTHDFLTDYHVFSYPSLFVLDKEGVIQEDLVPDPRRNLDQFIDYVQSFK